MYTIIDGCDSESKSICPFVRATILFSLSTYLSFLPNTLNTARHYVQSRERSLFVGRNGFEWLRRGDVQA